MTDYDRALDVQYSAQGGNMHQFVYLENNEYRVGTVAEYDTYRRHHATVRAMIDEFERYVKENAHTFDSGFLEQVADIFAFDMTRSYDIRISVDFVVNAEIPLDEDIDSIINEFSFEAENYCSHIDSETIDAVVINYTYSEA